MTREWMQLHGADVAAQIAEVAEKDDWTTVAQLAQSIPDLPSDWVVATFLCMEACRREGRLIEYGRQQDALQRL